MKSQKVAEHKKLLARERSQKYRAKQKAEIKTLTNLEFEKITEHEKLLARERSQRYRAKKKAEKLLQLSNMENDVPVE